MLSGFRERICPSLVLTSIRSMQWGQYERIVTSFPGSTWQTARDSNAHSAYHFLSPSTSTSYGVVMLAKGWTMRTFSVFGSITMHIPA